MSTSSAAKPAGQQLPEPRRSRRTLAVTAGIALAVAAAAVGANSMGDDPVPLPGRPPAPTPAQPAPSVPESATPSASAPPTPTPSLSPRRSTSPTASAAPTETPATLHLNQGLDLDTGRASDGAAGISDTIDIVVIAGGLRSGDYERRLALMPSGPPPTQDQCGALDPARPQRMLIGLNPGDSLCVYTTRGRWARVSITATGTSFTFTYLVWT